MEKFFLKRIKFALEVWQIGLLSIVALLGLIGFGAVVELAATNGSARGLPKMMLTLARIPAETKEIVTWVLTDHRPTLARSQRFEGEIGFKRFRPGPDETLLLSRIDGDKNEGVVEILDLSDGAILHRYDPDIASLHALSKKEPPLDDLLSRRTEQSYEIWHPILTEDGGIIFHGNNTPLAKIDVCSNVEWIVDKEFHHSIEQDKDGNFWASSSFYPPKLERVGDTGNDNTIIKISPDGEVLFEKSVGELLLENELTHLVYNNTENPRDPLHLNDVQPALSDGAYWKTGDLFLSLRHKSLVLLYRPSTNEVLWYRSGPWIQQHDVDILNDRQISIFDNNAAVLPWGNSNLGASSTVIYDFETDEVTSPFSAGFEKNDVRTVTQGLSDIRPNGEVFVEEQNYGRLLRMNEAGDITWQYVNRAQEDGRVYIVNWSRYLQKERALQAAALAAEKCN